MQSQVSKKYGDTKYKKSWIVTSQELFKKLGWKSVQKLRAETKAGKLIIEKN